MIRRLQEADIEKVAEIWLNTNIKAHYFVSSQYWEDHFESVKAMFSKAEVYVYEEKNSGRTEGFIGLSGDYIAGIFVCSEAQSRGIGRQLVNYAKGIRTRLKLNVYQKNTRAVKFYQREGFQIQCENPDEDTGEKEYIMVWKQ